MLLKVIQARCPLVISLVPHMHTTHLPTHAPADAHPNDQILTTFNQALMNITNVLF